MPSVLIVCTANICRSPMAEAILRHLVAGRPDAAEWLIESAGTWAVDGRRAASYSHLVMQLKGMDISAHRSQSIHAGFLRQFDLILTMESDQKEGLQLQYPECADRIYLLSEIVGVSKDIEDPIGGDISDYQEAADEIENILTKGFGNIIQLAQKSSSG